MTITNQEQVGRALELLNQGLYPFVEREMHSFYGQQWILEATPYVPKSRSRKRNVTEILRRDVSALLKLIIAKYYVVFHEKSLRQTERSLVSELLETRNDWAHNEPFSTEKAYRALDSVTLVLKAIGAKEADILEQPKKELLQKLLKERGVKDENVAGSDRKMCTIAIHAAKGGVGKTTLVVNLAYELAKKGKRVLVVDLDDSANTSLLLGVNKADEIENADDLEEIEKILHSFDDRKELIDFLMECAGKYFDGKKYIHPSSFNDYLNNQGTLDILPSSYRTRVQNLLTTTHPRKRLEWGLKHLIGQYDFVIIDTPPSTGIICENGLYAAQYWLIPSQMEYLSIYGIFEPLRKSKLIQEDTNEKHGNILGIVPMMTDAKLVLHKKIKKLVENTFPDIKVFSDVKRSTHVGMALSSRQPVSVYAYKTPTVPSEVANMFSEITEELLKEIQVIENKKK